MQRLITKIEAMSQDVREQLIGDGRIAQKAMPSSVASVINWAANECGTPILIIGQVVHAWCGTHYESTRMYDVMDIFQVYRQQG